VPIASRNVICSSGDSFPPAGAHDPVLQSQQCVELLPGQAHEPEKDGRGIRHRQLFGEIAGPPVDEGVDEAVHAGGDVVFDGIHLLRGEQGIEDLAVLEVLGRIDAQRNEWSNVAQLHDAARGVGLGIAQHLVDGVPAGHHGEALHGAQHPALFDDGPVLGLRLDQIEEVIEPLFVPPEHRRGPVLTLRLLCHGAPSVGLLPPPVVTVPLILTRGGQGELGDRPRAEWAQDTPRK
jgi:hypothetical protein